MQQQKEIILGIDPGTVIMGFALIEVNQQRISLLHMDVLKTHTSKTAYEKLENIYAKVCEIIQLHKPTCFAIEAPFFGKNVQSMLKLGRAQGVAIAAAMQSAIPVTEYSPKKVKQSITGNGNADKDQVFKMLQRIVTIEEKPQYLDATDALAVALCHHYQMCAPVIEKARGIKSWTDFVAKNPGKVLG